MRKWLGFISGFIFCATSVFASDSEQRDVRPQIFAPKATEKTEVSSNSSSVQEAKEVVSVENNQVIEFALGYTHNIFLKLPNEVKVETKSERNQNPLVTLESCDKQLLGQVCAKIRSFRKPEPYKGKGIKFVGEQIRRKAGKSAGAK